MKTHIPPAATVDEYLDRLPREVRSVLEKLRRAIRSAAPGAEELISYQMPAYKLYGPLVYFGAFNDHCSFFPAGSTAIADHKNELAPFKTSKGTIQFTIHHPLPLALVKKIVKARVRENEEKAMLKKLSRAKK